MNYYLDTEFNGFGGALMSLALVREDGESLYMVFPKPYRPDDWVLANVTPLLHDVPESVWVAEVPTEAAPALIWRFLYGDADPVIHTDWPDDVRYFCQAVIVGPGQMAPIPSLKFQVHRVDAYPTDLPGAVQHNAWWDAMALRHILLHPRTDGGGRE